MPEFTARQKVERLYIDDRRMIDGLLVERTSNTAYRVNGVVVRSGHSSVAFAVNLVLAEIARQIDEAARSKQQRYAYTYMMSGVCCECGSPCSRNARRCRECDHAHRVSRPCVACGQYNSRLANGLCERCNRRWRRQIVKQYVSPDAA